MKNEPNLQTSSQYGREWAGSQPVFPTGVGHDLPHSYDIDGFRLKRLVFGQFEQPGAVHVYSANCHAGGRLRAQALIPVLALGGGLAPAFAVVAQSLPYSADVHKLPIPLPAGYSALVAQPPQKLTEPVEDRLTRAQYYPGTVVDTRTLVSGRCYIIVWSPQNQMGKYALQIGHQWPVNWTYWLRTPLVWWRIRGWYGLSRGKAYVAGATLLGAAAAVMAWTPRRSRRT